MKVALIHEWLVTYAGSEKVLSEMLKEFPDADLYCLVDFSNGSFSKYFSGKKFRMSFLQHFRRFPSFYRNFLPLMPLAIEQLDLSSYDLIISNSHAISKGVITGPNQLHICYCYTPMRYAWDMQSQYLTEQKLDKGLKSWMARIILHLARIWDVRTANGVDHFIACSGYIAKRIWKVYRRTSEVVYCGVDMDFYTMGGNREEYYLTSSRMVPYKKMGLIVDAFRQMPDKRLVVIGDGPQFRAIKKIAGPNVSLLGYQDDQVLRRHMRAAKAFIFAAEEDFGITPLEAQACGTPVLAFGRGGALETVIDGVTGYYFHEQKVEAICAAVDRFEATSDRFDPSTIREHALKFSIANFRARFRALVFKLWDDHQETARPQGVRAA